MSLLSITISFGYLSLSNKIIGWISHSGKGEYACVYNLNGVNSQHSGVNKYLLSGTIWWNFINLPSIVLVYDHNVL